MRNVGSQIFAAGVILLLGLVALWKVASAIEYGTPIHFRSGQQEPWQAIAVSVLSLVFAIYVFIDALLKSRK